MAHTASGDLDHLTARIEQGQRKAVVRTAVLSIGTVAAAALVLFFTLREIVDARQQLGAVNSQIATANTAKQSAQTALKTTQDALKAAETRATTRAQQVNALEGKLTVAQKALGDSQKALGESQKALTESQSALAESKKALAEALNLGKSVYKLNWGELKMMFVEFGSAAPILDVIAGIKDRTHWGMSNSPAGGYNSPGFALLVLHKLNKIPANGTLAGLARDNGAPNIGDVVVYESGYHMFYFRDHERREFVVGMTPFGVTALNYEFGSKRVGVIHTGFGQR